MTRAEFDQAADYVHTDWWLTGEDLIHHNSVTGIEGWNLYGHPGNAGLTNAQRTLMMWSDLVGQAANGGFEQFAYNLRGALGRVEELLAPLEWPDLRRHLGPALLEQQALLKAQQFQEHWFTFEPGLGLIARSRSQMIEKLARARSGLNLLKRGPERARLNALGNDQLTDLYDEAVAQGLVRQEPARSSSMAEAEAEEATPASDAFDDWLYAPETKAASRQFVGAFIRGNADQLVRFTD